MDRLKYERATAGMIGSVAIISYVANYVLRNMLSVLTPYIVKSSNYTKEYLALLSSAYMFAYAIGQLVNGFIGDFIKPRVMVFLGLCFAGAATLVFPFASYNVLKYACFIVLGYGLSMMRGPLMKVISENMKAEYARITCVFFTFASFAGPLIAGIIAMTGNWKAAFVIAGGIAICVAFLAYMSFRMLEKHHRIQNLEVPKTGNLDVFGIFKIKGFFFYLLIACVVEIGAISISFWIPTFLNEYVQLSEAKSNMIYSFISFARALVPFATLWIYKIFREQDVLIMKYAYLIAGAAFAVALFVPAGIGTVVFLLIALLMNSIVTALLWSIYIPSLGKTGHVSSANGVIDCMGYLAASIATIIFAKVAEAFGWQGMIISWGAVSLTGCIVAWITNGKQKQHERTCGKE